MSSDVTVYSLERHLFNTPTRKSIFVKRNANTFSLNAIVDVRCRAAAVTKWFFFNISETIRDSDFKIYDRVALDSLYILTGNDVKTTSGQKQIVQTRFIDNGSTDSEKVYSFRNCDSSA